MHADSLTKLWTPATEKLTASRDLLLEERTRFTFSSAILLKTWQIYVVHELSNANASKEGDLHVRVCHECMNIRFQSAEVWTSMFDPIICV